MSKVKNILIIGGVIVAALILIAMNQNNIVTKFWDNAVGGSKVQLLEANDFAFLAKEEKNFLLDVHIPEQTHIEI